MSYFVFRTHTIERFFPREYIFSGYEDISVIPEEVDGYVWFYQLPLELNRENLSLIVKKYQSALKIVLNKISRSKLFLAVTLDCSYLLKIEDDENQLEDFVNEYNSYLYLLSKQFANVKVMDIKDFHRKYQLSDLVDWRFYFMSSMLLNPKFSDAFMSWWNTKLKGISHNRKKCLVLDLDNTLWSGILGEEGPEGICIGGSYPGNAFSYFQAGLKELSDKGIILTICSKNNEPEVLNVLDNHSSMILKRNYFSAVRINWRDKVSNIKELSEELNIGLDSMVFVDDNPSERELVKQMLPMVDVPEFPKHPYELPVFLHELIDNYFCVYHITEDDKKKRQQYHENSLRLEAATEYSDFEKFLEMLELGVSVETLTPFTVQRAAQLSQKTNQFNLCTKRYTDEEIMHLVDNDWHIYTLSVCDKFGDYGLTGLAMVTPQGKIDNFMLSCRILGKGIEFVFIKLIFKNLIKLGYSRIEATYIPTLKNEQVKDFYQKCGFTQISCNTDGNVNYSINLNSANLNIEKYYRILREM